MKAVRREHVVRFQDIPNVGKRVENDFKKLGFKSPKELVGQDGFLLYKKLCALTKTHQDPCVLDTLLAVCDFMSGASAKPWWFYTRERKKKFPKL